MTLEKRPLRIGIDASLACTRRPTGVEHCARSMLAELVRLRHPRVQWFVYVSPFASPGCDFPDGVTVRTRPDFNTLLKKPWLVAQTWRDRLDVIFTFGHLLPPACRGRRVLTVYDTAFDEFPDCYPPGAAVTAHREVEQSCREAVRLVTLAEATRARLIEDYQYPADRIDVVHAASREAFVPGTNSASSPELLAVGVRAPYFLCVGRLDRRKNVERVIVAYRKLVAERGLVGQLVIAGPADSGSGGIQSRLARNAVPGEDIVLTGYVGEDTLLQLYRSATALIYPSLAEGFGLPILEALACGTPTITSTVSCMPEVAADAALLIDPTDTEAIAAAMQRVANDEVLRERLRLAGLARAAQFSWRRSAELIQGSVLLAAGQSL